MELKQPPARPSALVRGLVAAACVIVLLAGLRAARVIIVPVLVAVFISVACAPLVNGMRRYGVPTWLAVVIVVLGVLAFGLVLTLFVGEALAEFVRGLPRHQAALAQHLADFYLFLEERGVRVPEEQVAFNPGVAFNWVAILLGSLSALLTSGLLILLTIVFILLESAGFEEKLRRAVRNPQATIERFALFAVGVKRYLFIKTMVSLVTGTFVAVWVAILGLDFPLLWGLLALVEIGFGRAALVLLGYLAINIAMGNIIEPRWAGRGVGLSPLVVFLSLILWGWVFGPVGLLLAAPLTMTLKLALESNPHTMGMAILLGPEKAPDPAPELRLAAERRAQAAASGLSQ